jgi:Tol biopolymer transport system component
MTVLPGSEGLHHGSLSPDGRQIVAISVANKSIVLYELQTHLQTDLAKGTAVVNPCWSHDGREVFFQDFLQGSDQPIYRVRIDNHRVERVTNFAQPFAADVTTFLLTGITPDNQVLAILIRSNSDLYALDVDFP